MNKIIRTDDELDQIYTDGQWEEANYGSNYVERGARDVYEIGRQDAKNELIAALNLDSSGDLQENIKLADTLLALSQALQEEKDRTASLNRDQTNLLEHIVTAIYAGQQPSIYAGNAEFNRGVDSAIEWSVGIVQEFKEFKEVKSHA